MVPIGTVSDRVEMQFANKKINFVLPRCELPFSSETSRPTSEIRERTRRQSSTGYPY